MNIVKLLIWWTIAFAATVIGIAICYRYIDFPVAVFFVSSERYLGRLGHVFRSTAMISIELSAVFALMVFRLIKGKFTDGMKLFLLALLVSIIAFAVNDLLLKFLFGRIAFESYFTSNADIRFNFFQGDLRSSFPSGHMMAATAFSATILRIRARIWPLFAATLSVLAFLLLAGGWHYVSDIIAGVFLGCSFGLMAGEFWIRYTLKGPIEPVRR